MTQRLAILVFGVGFVLWAPLAGYSQVRYYGYQFAESDNPAHTTHLTGELAGYGNVIEYEYYPGYTPPGNLLRSNHMKAFFTLPIPHDVLFGTSTSRQAYFNNIKNADVEDILGVTVLITLDDEWYTRLHLGHFFNASWPEFQYLSMHDAIVLMKQKLEETIADAKAVFPGIPIKLTENIWGDAAPGFEWAPPPSNVDVLGLDAYWPAYGSTSCDSTNRANFMNDVRRWYVNADAFGLPMVMTAGAFKMGDGSTYSILSSCQLQWYLDVADEFPRVMGVVWFLYKSQYDDRNSMWWYGLNEPEHSDQLANIKAWGTARIHHNMYSYVDIPTPSATVSGSGFQISGWAVDVSALPNSTTAGIDTIHIWAFANGDGPGTFLGIPNFHESRPDLAAALGPQFNNSGYTLNTSALNGQTGWFLILVYEHSGETGTFTWLPQPRWVYVQ